MTRHHEGALDALTDRDYADEMAAVNDRLRARIAELEAQVAALTFELKRLQELAEVRHREET